MLASNPSGGDTSLNAMSSVIGELRNFAAQQNLTNTHMLEELKKISERMSSFGEVGATFVEYRKTLHERFGKIHEQIGSIDMESERLQDRITGMEMQIATWRSNWKLLVSMLLIISTLASALITNYGSAIIKSVLVLH